MEKKSGIYKIVNLFDGKVYIGQSVNIRRRRNIHKYTLRCDKHGNCHLQLAWNKHGQDNFKFELIEYCPEEKLDIQERYWIKYYDSTNKKYGYNNESGGCKNKHMSEETKLKVSKTKKGNSPAPRKGIKMSQETKQRISYSKGHEVICLTTKFTFYSVLEASKYYNINKGNLAACCRGERSSCGKLPDGTKLQWMYCTEYMKEVV